jgi:circadian clock protein KaiB
VRRLQRLKFRVYVTGTALRSAVAVGNLRAICEARVPGAYEIEVVDVRRQPELAERDRVLATPTVLRLAPGPSRWVIGDLSDRRLAALALELPDPEAAYEQGA